ncbi:MAG: hypothetical protein SOS98_00040 [Varibaculum sp.]|nr:hypothetical protein [Varibaculum sp.]
MKLTGLGDVLRRNKAMTFGEFVEISRALGLVPWKTMRQAEQNLTQNQG